MTLLGIGNSGNHTDRIVILTYDFQHNKVLINCPIKAIFILSGIILSAITVVQRATVRNALE